ncbi:MAG TPA: hypothetical protein VE035_07530 [Puia sp.]|nr:hypothetical protein [Puia sp.]
MGSALLVMGIAGGALIPLLYGTLKDKLQLPNGLSFILCTLPCYIYIYYYSVRGYQKGSAPSGRQPAAIKLQ